MNTRSENHIPLKRWPGLWLAIGGPLAFALVVMFGIKISDTTVGGFCWTSVCWANFVVFFKVPIAIAGLAIPLAAIVTAIHRSDETAIQIAEALSNNVFGNYLKHRSAFVEYVDAKSERLLVGKARIRFDAIALYEMIYPRNDFSNLEIYSDQGAHFWSLMESRLMSLYQVKELTSHATSELVLALNLVYQALHCRIEGGSIVSDVDSFGLRVELSPASDLLSGLTATIRLVFDFLQLLQAYSASETDFDMIQEMFDTDWTYAVYNACRGTHQFEH